MTGFFDIPTPESFRCGRCGNLLDGATDAPVERKERDEARADVERLRDIIGGLYMLRSKDNATIYDALRAAFRDSRGER